MSGTKHTPGPWAWEAWGDDPNDKRTLAAPPSSRRDGPCKMFPDLGEQILCLDEPVEHEADAHLIAAAPELLKELACAAEAVADLDNGGAYATEYDKWMALLKKARGA